MNAQQDQRAAQNQRNRIRRALAEGGGRRNIQAMLKLDRLMKNCAPLPPTRAGRKLLPRYPAMLAQKTVPTLKRPSAFSSTRQRTERRKYDNAGCRGRCQIPSVAWATMCQTPATRRRAVPHTDTRLRARRPRQGPAKKNQRHRGCGDVWLTGRPAPGRSCGTRSRRKGNGTGRDGPAG